MNEGKPDIGAEIAVNDNPIDPIQKRTPAVIAQELRQIQQNFRVMTLMYAVEAGRRLVEAKALVDHGEWGDWVKNEAGMSSSSASRLMKLYKEYASDELTLEGAVVNSSTLQNLSISNALRLLAVPEEERETFAKENDVEHLSAREMDKLIKQRETAEAERDAAKKQAAEQEQAAKDALQQVESAMKEQERLKEELAAARKRAKDLESRPVEVAVQVDEEAVKKAAEDAKAAAAAHVADLEKRLKAAEEKAEKAAAEVQAASEKAKSAESAAARELDTMKQQLAAAEKRIALSEPAVVEFKVVFDDANRAFNRMLELISGAGEEQRGKLTAAVKGLLDAFGQRVGAA